MTETPEILSQTPDPPDAEYFSHGVAPADALSSVLTLARMQGEVVCDSVFTAPLGVAFPAGPIHFHAVESGTAWVIPGSGDPPLRVGAGSCVLFPRGDGHVIADAPERAGIPLADLARQGFDPDTLTFRAGGDGDEARMMCARFRCENPVARYWLDALPSVIHVRPETGRPPGWLDLTARALIEEVANPRPGAAVAIARLLDLLFVQVLRMWGAEIATDGSWLAGAADPRIGRVLAAIHRDPAHPWTVVELAARAGLSRSAFADRFTTLVGEAPGAYIASWRMSLAAALLRGGAEPVGIIANKVGYRSEAAFSRAFKARFSKGPRAFRRQTATGDPADLE